MALVGLSRCSPGNIHISPLAPSPGGAWDSRKWLQCAIFKLNKDPVFLMLGEGCRAKNKTWKLWVSSAEFQTKWGAHHMMMMMMMTNILTDYFWLATINNHLLLPCKSDWPPNKFFFFLFLITFQGLDLFCFDILGLKKTRHCDTHNVLRRAAKNIMIGLVT